LKANHKIQLDQLAGMVTYRLQGLDLSYQPNGRRDAAEHSRRWTNQEQFEI